MKILLVNHKDANDINAYSGVSFFMSKALKETFPETVEYYDLESYHAIRSNNGTSQNKFLKKAGKRLNDYLSTSALDFDFILCQGGNSSIPYYNNKIPIAYWHDCTWSSLLGFSKSQQSFNEFKKKHRDLFIWDKLALERANIVFFSSEYIGEACMKYYNLPKSKIYIVPFGANIDRAPDAQILTALVKKRVEAKILNLTFIGKDWKRKNLKAAFQLTKRLNEIGIKSNLNVIGYDPNFDAINGSEIVTFYGFIDKQDVIEMGVFMDVLHDTHFLIHPAISEPFGVVLCEANAYGIPVFGTSIDGLKTIIIDHNNGYLFKKNRFVNHATEKIKTIMINFDEQYTSLSHSTKKEFDKRLNWGVNTMKVKQILENYQ